MVNKIFDAGTLDILKCLMIGLDWFMVFNNNFQQYFSYIVAVSFIGRGNQSTQRKPLTCCKSLTNFLK